MNNTNTNSNENNNMIIITIFIQASPQHRLLSLLQKSDNAYILHIKNKNTKKLLILS